MIDDAMLLGTWTTPGGSAATFAYRDRTVDWNVLSSIMTNDEYGLARVFPKVAIDVGAYIGGVTIALALDYPDCHIYAVEPIPENLELLRDNIERNGVESQVTIMEGSVGVDIIAYGGDDSDAALQNAYVGNASGVSAHPKRTIHAHRYTLDDFPRADFLKIDCEGGEWAFLDDESIASFPYIVGEVHDIFSEVLDPGYNIRDEFRSLLKDTHDVTFTGTEDHVCGFLATRRA